jgi:DNA-binding NtrC family response regulator
MGKKKVIVIDDEQIVLDSVSARDIKRVKPSLPVVIITGYATVQLAVQATKLGAAQIVEKPFEPEELLKAISNALGSAQEVDEQALIHKEEMSKVLERAESDDEFFASLLENAVSALDEYDLTKPEKLAIVTGDIKWIEDEIGRLTRAQRRMLVFLKVQSSS